MTPTPSDRDSGSSGRDRDRALRWRRPVLPWERRRDPAYRRLGLAGVGLEFGALVVVGLLLGLFLDNLLQSTPWLLVVCVLAAVALATWRLIWVASRIDPDDPGDGKSPPPKP